MRKAQTGFTMIELIVVIVILGILAATALPKFVDLRTDALASVAGGMSEQLASGMKINYGGCAANSNVPAANRCVAISNCSQAVNLLMGGVFPANGSVTFSITAAALGSGAAGANGTTGLCTLTATNGTQTATTTFTGISAGL